jgi:hypothetical protein
MVSEAQVHSQSEPRGRGRPERRAGLADRVTGQPPVCRRSIAEVIRSGSVKYHLNHIPQGDAGR